MTPTERQDQIDRLHMIGFCKLADYMQIVLERDMRAVWMRTEAEMTKRTWTGVVKR